MDFLDIFKLAIEIKQEEIGYRTQMHEDDGDTEDLCADSSDRSWMVVPLLLEIEDDLAIRVIKGNQRDD